MSSDEEATKAIAALDEKELDGRMIVVKPANPNPLLRGVDNSFRISTLMSGPLHQEDFLFIRRIKKCLKNIALIFYNR